MIVSDSLGLFIVFALFGVVIFLAGLGIANLFVWLTTRRK